MFSCQMVTALEGFACLLACLLARNLEPFFFALTPYFTAERRVKDACCMLQKRKKRDTSLVIRCPRAAPLSQRQKSIHFPQATLGLLPSPCLSFHIPPSPVCLNSLVPRRPLSHGYRSNLALRQRRNPYLAYMKQGRSNGRRSSPRGVQIAHDVRYYSGQYVANAVGRISLLDYGTFIAERARGLLTNWCCTKARGDLLCTAYYVYIELGAAHI